MKHLIEIINESKLANFAAIALTASESRYDSNIKTQYKVVTWKEYVDMMETGCTRSGKDIQNLELLGTGKTKDEAMNCLKPHQKSKISNIPQRIK